MQIPETASQYGTIEARLSSAELAAWRYARIGQYDNAAVTIGSMIDESEDLSDTDVGWYLQLQAAYLYHADKDEALQKQLKAHELNYNVLKPPSGVNYRRRQAMDTNQAHAVLEWARSFTEQNALVIETQTVTHDLAFGVRPNDFEQALDQLARILGFWSERSEKKITGGPDVLWQMTNGHYLIFEAKDCVDVGRSLIHKKEAAQIGHSVNWFKEHYSGEPCSPVLIHPSLVLANDAVLPHGCNVMQSDDLQGILKSVSEFVATLASKPSNQWRPSDIEVQIRANGLRPSDLLERRLGKPAVYSRK